MFRQPAGGMRPGVRLRRWAVRIGIACLLLEVFYLIVGNLCMRVGVLEDLINYQPEENFVSWKSGFTVFPGFVSFKEFTYRGQTRGSQVYVHLTDVRAHIGLRPLLLKSVYITGVHGRDLDYRYRERIDFPCWTEESGEPFPGTPENIDDYPEIPGFENPPDPKPEDLYSKEDEPRPWTVKFSGAHIEGPIHVAHNELRLHGDGWVEGGMTFVLGESTAINRGKVRLTPATLHSGSRELTDDLDVDVDVRVEPYPAECCEESEFIGGMSGSLEFSGLDSNGFGVDMVAFAPLLPGQSGISIESGTGELAGRMELDGGIVTSGRLDLKADDLVVRRQDALVQGDMELHSTLETGNLANGQFDISGTTFRLDDIGPTGDSARQQMKLEPWYGHLEFEEGIVRWGEPVTLDSRVRLKMHDTRPLLVLMRKFTNELKWLSLTRNVKGLDGTMDLDLGEGSMAIENLQVSGENVEILGWIHIRNGQKYGRIFARHGSRAAAVAFDGDQSKLVTIRPRRWFEKQETPPANDVPAVEKDDK